MAHSELTQKIIEIAAQIQEEENKSYCAPIFYYLAIRKILADPSLIQGINIDESEINEVKSIIKSQRLASLEQVENAINSHSYSYDESEAKNMKRWFCLTGRSTVDVIKFISDDCKANCFDAVEPENDDSTNEVIKPDEKPDKSIEEDSKADDNPLFKRYREKLEEQAETEKIGRPVSDVVLTTGKLKSEIKKYVFGQNNAVNKFVNTFFKGEYLSETDNRKRGPRCLFTFLGMPGVGKTYLAQIAAESIGRPCIKFDMSNGTSEIIANRPKDYRPVKDANDFVSKYPESIVLFDEIEKAPVPIILKYLSMIDAGTSAGVDFRDCIIIFTTNAGKPLYSMTEYGRLSNIPDAIIKDTLIKEIDPITGKPFFPPEFVSRLATGSLIMFDRLSASDLIYMTTKEFSRHIENTKKRYAIDVEFDKNTTPTALFSLGGDIDGRNATNKGKTFFTDDIYELLMLSSEERGYEVADRIKKVKIDVNVDDAPDDVRQLYKNEDNLEIVFFAEENVRKLIEKKDHKCIVKCPDSLKEYLDIMAQDDVTAAFIDYKVGMISDDNLDVEDIISDGRKAFDETVNKYKDTTPYIFSYEYDVHNNAEKSSLISKGAQDVIVLPKDVDSFIDEKCHEISMNNALETLRFRHKVLNYNMIQTLSEDGTEAAITLYDLRLNDAIDAEDRKAIMTEDDCPDMTWDDIVVSKKNQEKLEYFISYLKNPKAFLAKTKVAPKGLLFYGPPGTGKTSIAKVIASISGVRFIATAGANFESRWAGHTTENVIKMFARARKNAPCILFIDEIDAIGGKRANAGEDTGGAVKDQNSVVTALLNEMDGFKKSPDKPVFVIAATNEKDSLDPALLRRFDESILLDNPDKDGRIKVLKLLRQKNSDIVKISDEFIENLAVRSIGKSPAELEKAINAAISIAIRRGTDVTDELLDETFEESLYGEEKKWSDSELLTTARHEVGHAFISRYYGETPDYLTIVARGDHGGYSLSIGDEKKGSYNKTEMLNNICVSLGGRAAEIVYYGDDLGMTTGPSSDLYKATSMARDMICRYGMSEKLGLISTGALENSEALNNRIIDEIAGILDEQLEIAKKIIVDNREQFDKFVDALMVNHSMTKDDIDEILAEEK